jgi:hypothetical protein
MWKFFFWAEWHWDGFFLSPLILPSQCHSTNAPYSHFINLTTTLANPSGARSKACVCCRSLTGIAGSNPAGGMDVLSLVSVVGCLVEVSATGRSLVQRSPTECGVSECDREASTVRRPWPTRGCQAMKEEKQPHCTRLAIHSVVNKAFCSYIRKVPQTFQKS